MKVGCEHEVFGMVKPSSPLEHGSGLDREISNLGGNDHLVILGGTNNIDCKIRFYVKKCVNNIASKTKHTNVIVCSIPLTYDKPDLNPRIR